MKDQEFTFFIILLCEFIISLIPIIIGIYRFNHLDKITFGILLFALIYLGFNIPILILWWYKTSNLYLINVYTIFEFLIISYIFILAFKNFTPKYLLEIIIILFTSFSVIKLFWIEESAFFDSYQKIIECLIFIILSLLYFYKISKELIITHLNRDSMFWFSVGVLLYFSGGLFIFIFSNYLLNYSKELRLNIWGIHAFFLILFHLIISISLWVSPKK